MLSIKMKKNYFNNNIKIAKKMSNETRSTVRVHTSAKPRFTSAASDESV